DEVGPRRAGVTEVAHLDRRRPVGQNANPGIFGMAGDIDHDVDRKLADERRDLAVRSFPYIMEAINGCRYPRPWFAALIGPIGDGVHFKAGTIVLLQQPHNAIADGMAAKVG